jgi:hypothetical protein
LIDLSSQLNLFKVIFHDAKVKSDADLKAYRDLDADNPGIRVSFRGLKVGELTGFDHSPFTLYV